MRRTDWQPVGIKRKPEKGCIGSTEEKQFMTEDRKNFLADTSGNDILMIPVDLIMPNPNNPRKDLGNLEELTESVKRNGIMQNLMVVRRILPDGREGYSALIGHRRLAAAKLAGLKKVPCIVVDGLTDSDELGIMLEENMQRTDLTIVEQAQSFQLLLDLGETENSIAEKTGFSRATVRHRLAIAKLDQDVLQKKISGTEYRLSFVDIYALERIKDISERNRILEKASSSDNLRWLIHQFIQNQERKDAIDRYTCRLIEAGAVQEYGRLNESKYEKVLTIWPGSANAEDNRNFDEILKNPSGLRFTAESWNIIIYRPWADGRRLLSDREKEQRKRDAGCRAIKKIYKQMSEEERIFIADLIRNKSKEDDPGIKNRLWNLLLGLHSSPSAFDSVSLISGMEYYKAGKEKMDRLRARIPAISVMYQMMATVWVSVKNLSLQDFDGSYNRENGKLVKEFYEILGLYGFSYQNQEYVQIVEGTHEVYISPDREEQEANLHT